MIREAFKRRTWWIEIPNFLTSLFNFKWQPVSTGIKFRDIQSATGVKQIINHLECHKEITSKSRLLSTMRVYFENRKENVFDFTPLSFFVEINTSRPNSKFQSLAEFNTVFNALSSSKKAFKKIGKQNKSGKGKITTPDKIEISKLIVRTPIYL